MSRIQALYLALAGAALAAALLAPTTVSAYGGPAGVHGRVTVSPTSPLGSSSRPYQATVTATDKQGRVVSVHTDSAGNYAISLHPGTYTIRGVQVGFLPRAPWPVVVTIRGTANVEVDLAYDSGIR